MNYHPELVRVENALDGVYGVAWQTVGNVVIARAHLDHARMTRATEAKLRDCSDFLGFVNESGALVWSDYSDADHGLVVLGPYVAADSASEDLLRESGLLKADPEEARAA